jgi:hypothetical protein
MERCAVCEHREEQTCYGYTPTEDGLDLPPDGLCSTGRFQPRQDVKAKVVEEKSK